MWSSEVTNMIIAGIGETLYMTLVSTIAGYIIGLPMGIVLTVTDKDGIRPNALVYKILDVIVNIVRSIPFIILLVLLLVSGVIIWRPYFAPAFSIPVIRFALMLHSFAAVALIVVIMVHIYAALWVKGTITAMVEGWVTKTWAKKHHPRWYREVRQKQEKSSE